MLLLDTSTLIELEHELADQLIGPIRRFLGAEKRDALACTAVTIGELAAGTLNEQKVRVLVQHLRKVSINEVIAYRAAALERQLSAHGQRLGANDNWIAATALVYSATLVHCDADFVRVPGLKQRHLDVD